MKKQLVVFKLSMPGVGSWDGKWSGGGDWYAVVRSLDSEEVARSLGRKTYAFGDGWVAAVEGEAVDAKEARRIRAGSQGFLGYGWMVDSIVACGKIVASEVGS